MNSLMKSIKRSTGLVITHFTSAVKSLTIDSKEDRFASVRHNAAFSLVGVTSRLFTRVKSANSFWRNR